MNRSIKDLFDWKIKILTKSNKLRDKDSSERNQKLSKIMSTKIINPHSQVLASRIRNNKEKIEDRLIREGEKTK